MDQMYVGVVAAFAVAQDVDPDEAWTLAQKVSEEIPDDLQRATREAARRARAAAW